MELTGAVVCQQLQLTPVCTHTPKRMHTDGLRPPRDAYLLISWGNRAFLLPGMFVIQ